MNPQIITVQCMLFLAVTVLTMFAVSRASRQDVSARFVRGCKRLHARAVAFLAPCTCHAPAGSCRNLSNVERID